MQDGGFGMEDMNLDDLGLLPGVIKIWVLFHILVHGLRFPMLQCNIFTYSVNILIHSPYAYLECEITLVLTWSPSMYYNCSIFYLAFCATWFIHRLWSAQVRLYLLLMRLDLFVALCHNVLVMTHVCSIMVSVCSVDVTFSWLVSTPVLRWVVVVVHFFLVVDSEWVMLVIADDYSCSCGFCT
jgi:hypothetical protein